MRNSSKFVRDQQKYMQFAGKSTRIAGKNTRQTQAKITANARKNTRTIAGKNTCNSTHNHLQLQVSQPSLHPAGEVTCNLRALLSAIACILREVLAAQKQVQLSVFTGKLHVTQVNCMWGLITSELQVQSPAFAGNAILSKIYHFCGKAGSEDAQTQEAKLQCIAKAHQLILQNPMAKKYKHF